MSRKNEEQVIIDGRALKGWLKAKGWSQNRLAKELGISPSQISRLISGKSGIGVKALLALPKAGIDPFALVLQVDDDTSR